MAFKEMQSGSKRPYDKVNDILKKRLQELMTKEVSDMIGLQVTDKGTGIRFWDGKIPGRDGNVLGNVKSIFRKPLKKGVVAANRSRGKTWHESGKVVNIAGMEVNDIPRTIAEEIFHAADMASYERGGIKISLPTRTDGTRRPVRFQLPSELNPGQYKFASTHLSNTPEFQLTTLVGGGKNPRMTNALMSLEGMTADAAFPLTQREMWKDMYKYMSQPHETYAKSMVAYTMGGAKGKGAIKDVLGAERFELFEGFVKKIIERKPEGFRYGGQVKHFQAGGKPMGTDTVPAMLTPGEFVVRKEAVNAIGVGNLNRINAMGFAKGGPVQYLREGGGAVSRAEDYQKWLERRSKGGKLSFEKDDVTYEDLKKRASIPGPYVRDFFREKRRLEDQAKSRMRVERPPVLSTSPSRDTGPQPSRRRPVAGGLRPASSTPRPRAAAPPGTARPTASPDPSFVGVLGVRTTPGPLRSSPSTELPIYDLNNIEQKAFSLRMAGKPYKHLAPAGYRFEETTKGPGSQRKLLSLVPDPTNITPSTVVPSKGRLRPPTTPPLPSSGRQPVSIPPRRRPTGFGGLHFAGEAIMPPGLAVDSTEGMSPALIDALQTTGPGLPNPLVDDLRPRRTDRPRGALLQQLDRRSTISRLSQRPDKRTGGTPRPPGGKKKYTTVSYRSAKARIVDHRHDSGIAPVDSDAIIENARRQEIINKLSKKELDYLDIIRRNSELQAGLTDSLNKEQFEELIMQTYIRSDREKARARARKSGLGEGVANRYARDTKESRADFDRAQERQKRGKRQVQLERQIPRILHLESGLIGVGPGWWDNELNIIGDPDKKIEPWINANHGSLDAAIKKRLEEIETKRKEQDIGTVVAPATRPERPGGQPQLPEEKVGLRPGQRPGLRIRSMQRGDEVRVRDVAPARGRKRFGGGARGAGTVIDRRGSGRRDYAPSITGQRGERFEALGDIRRRNDAIRKAKEEKIRAKKKSERNARMKVYGIRKDAEKRRCLRCGDRGRKN